MQKLNNVKLFSNGLQFNSKMYKDYVLNEDNDFIYEKENIKVEDNKALMACINLGKFVYENNDLLNDFAKCYVINQNIERNKNISLYRSNNKLKIERFNLYGNYYYINLNNINNLYSNQQEYLIPKYVNDKKLLRLLKKWYIACGMSNYEVEELRNSYYKILKMENILQIMDFSKHVFMFFKKYIENDIKDEIIINLDLVVKTNDNGVLEVNKRVANLNNLIYLSLISYFKSDKKSLRQCEYCNDFFFGRKSKKCCSSRCKDLKNRKDEKKKERKKNDTMSKQKQI